MKKEGFIVHPFETGNGKYHASYGNHNKTVKSFNTLAEAKAHLKRKGMSQALYDSPAGTKTLKLDKERVRRNPVQRQRVVHFGW